MVVWVLDEGRQRSGKDCSPCPDSLTHAAAVKGGFSYLLCTIINDCVTFSLEENRPLHVDTGMKSFCLFQSVFQHFLPSHSFSSSRVPGDLGAWMASNKTPL